MLAISEVSPIATMPITIARPSCTPAILVSAARVPCRGPLAITSVTIGPGNSASAMQAATKAR
jgi:hypothetical protein